MSPRSALLSALRLLPLAGAFSIAVIAVGRDPTLARVMALGLSGATLVLALLIYRCTS